MRRFRTASLSRTYSAASRKPPPIVPRVEETGGRSIPSDPHFQPEPGLNLTARVEYGKRNGGPPLAILVDLGGAAKAGDQRTRQ